MFQGSIYITIVFFITHIMNKYREPLTHGVTGIIWRLVALLHKEVRCCCIYDNQTLKISIFCSYYLHWTQRRLCLQIVIHPVLAVLSVLLFVRLKCERYDILC